MITALRRWAKVVRRDAVLLWLAARDPRTPWLPRLLALLIAAYALSPVDLIPDVIPVLGMLDDLILLPLALLAVLRLLPAPLREDLRQQAEALAGRPVSRMAAAVIVGLWLAAALAAGLILCDPLGCPLP